MEVVAAAHQELEGDEIVPQFHRQDKGAAIGVAVLGRGQQVGGQGQEKEAVDGPGLGVLGKIAADLLHIVLA